MCLYLGRGWLHTPMFVHLFAPICSYAPHTFVCPPGCTPPQGPPCFCAPAWFWHIACCGGLFFLFYVYWDTPPLFGGASPLFTPPHSVGSLCIVILRDISSYVGLSPSIEGFGGVPPITGGGWGDTSAAVHMLILLHLFL